MKLKLSLFFGLIFLFASCTEKDQADLVITNAKIYSADSIDRFHEAMVVSDGKIIAIGGSDLLEEYKADSLIDLSGKTVLPGFIDSHVHFLTGGQNLSSVQLRNAKTPYEFIELIRDYAKTLEKGEWILGGDWDHEQWGGELPEANWIDSVTSENPVWINRLDGHMALANSLAMNNAGIRQNTKSPQGGEIVKTQEGISGIFKDNAMGLIQKAVPNFSTEIKMKHLLSAMNYVNSHGVTSVHDMGSWDDLKIYQKAYRDSVLSVRIYSNVPLFTWAKLSKFIEKNGSGNHWLKFGGLKGFVDGSLGSHTAAFFEGYKDAPEERGFFVTPAQTLKKQIKSADSAGLKVMVHAIGDSAIHELINVYETVIAANGPKDRRFRIEHTQHIHPKDISQLNRMKIIPSMQPYHAIDDGRWAEKVIKKEIADYTYAFKSLEDGGVRVAFGSDWFVAPPIPLLGIYAAVTRRTLDSKNPNGWIPEQKISVMSAVRNYTINAAYASFEEENTGSLEIGKYADFVILDRDIFTINPVQIRDTKILGTFIEGKAVYKND